MTDNRIDQQEHGYRNGHQLLSSSLRLPRDDQDTIDRLSDVAGPLRPGEIFDPYLTTYPLPGGSHYVVARTSQDLAAPRAGCVLTRSLLVPLALWERIDDPASLLVILLPVQPGESVKPVSLIPAQHTLPSVSDARIFELTEALFLESRQPVVVFDSSEAETIALRLLTALWPSLRRKFAVCTFSLSPRKIAGRDFDLLFAPKSARARFSDWHGRRIDVATSIEPRHRWSSAMAGQIFRSERPSLAANDALGALALDNQGDESALRLSLLWNELSAKADSNPTAVLGLLDILNSQRGLLPNQSDRLLPFIHRSIEQVGEQGQAEHAWRFLMALATKFPDGLAPEVRYAATRAATRAAAREPSAALSFLSLEALNGREVPSYLLGGMAEGLGEAEFPPLEGLTDLSSHQAMTLMNMSRSLAELAFREVKEDSPRSITKLQHILTAATRADRSLARAQWAALFDDAVMAPLLGPLLDDATGEEITFFTLEIGRSSHFRVVAFDDPLARAARVKGSLPKLRNAVAREFYSGEADRFLRHTLEGSEQDIHWICEVLPAERARDYLLQIFRDLPESTLQAIGRNASLAERVIEILSGDFAAGASWIVRLLLNANLPIAQLIDVGLRALPFLADDRREHLSHHLLSRALAEASLSDARVPDLIEQAGRYVSARDLVLMATAEGPSAARIAENLELFDRASSAIRMGVMGCVDVMSGRLVNLHVGNLGQAAYDAWARMIAATPSDVQIRAASPSLVYALRHRRFPVTPLIAAAFPMVYRALVRSQEEDELTLPAFMALSLSFFVDMNRAKSARQELVDAFLDSNWPPADLLVIALTAGIDGWVLGQLHRTKSGRHYINRIESDAVRLEFDLKKQVRKSLKAFNY